LKGGKRAAFYTGGNSTCRAENHHAIPRDILKENEEAKLKGKKQTKIDNILEKSTAPQEFTREAVLHAVAQFVACDDQV